MTDTPRTYEEWNWANADGGERFRAVDADFCEQLERELNETKRFLDGERIARQYAIDKGVELQRENFKMKEALAKIANLPTDQLASPEQCVAVVLAMDALSELPNVKAQR